MSNHTYAIARRLDDAATINVEVEEGHNLNGGDYRAVNANVADSASVNVRLFQAPDGLGYASEDVNVHFETDTDRRPLQVTVRTHEEAQPGKAHWATIEFEREYHGPVDDTGRLTAFLGRSVTSFIAADELVEIRDALTKAIQQGRIDGHINQEGA